MANVRYTKELLTAAVQQSFSWAAVCRYFGVKPATGTQTHLRKRGIHFGVDYSHFTGQGHNRGKTFEKKPLSFYLVENSNIRSDTLKKRLIKEGIKKHECEHCGITTWCGEPAPLELDHINGVHEDNRFSNLRILCCNCHALTETYCRRKIASVVERDTQ